MHLDVRSCFTSPIEFTCLGWTLYSVFSNCRWRGIIYSILVYNVCFRFTRLVFVFWLCSLQIFRTPWAWSEGYSASLQGLGKTRPRTLDLPAPKQTHLPLDHRLLTCQDNRARQQRRHTWRGARSSQLFSQQLKCEV